MNRLFSILLLLGTFSWQIDAFAPASQSVVNTAISPQNTAVQERRKSTKCFLSDIPRDNDTTSSTKNKARAATNSLQKWIRSFKPPPKPEDQFVMTGDLLSLCVYGITDHFFCQVVSKLMVANTLEDMTHHLSRAAGGDTNLLVQAPAWMDPNAPYVNQVLENNLNQQLVTTYSPILEPMGQATVLLVACWLLSGWFHEAFSFKNTLNCSTERAILVTGRTWLTACAMLFSIVWASQAACGCDHFYLVTRGDLDFVLDSSTVLVMWRFLISFMLGSGKDE